MISVNLQKKKKNIYSNQVGSIVQTFSTKTIHIGLESSKITNKSRGKLDILRSSLRRIRLLRREVERPRENRRLKRLSKYIFGSGIDNARKKLQIRTLKV